MPLPREGKFRKNEEEFNSYYSHFCSPCKFNPNFTDAFAERVANWISKFKAFRVGKINPPSQLFRLEMASSLWKSFPRHFETTRENERKLCVEEDIRRNGKKGIRSRPAFPNKCKVQFLTLNSRIFVLSLSVSESDEVNVDALLRSVWKRSENGLKIKQS